MLLNRSVIFPYLFQNLSLVFLLLGLTLGLERRNLGLKHREIAVVPLQSFLKARDLAKVL